MEINKAKMHQTGRGNRGGARNKSRGGTTGMRGTATSNRKLENKLLTMLYGDRAGAQRLLNGAKQMYPGKPNDWYWEKVISDLERDRR